MAVGRISGPLLKDNLLRDGVNLAFENDLLYLDVINNRIGVKTASPAYDLDINGTTRTTNLEVTTQADIASFTISGNTIASSNGTIDLVPASGSPVVYQAKLVLDDLQISTNTIEITASGTDLNFETLGTGTVNVNNNMLVNGDIHATGNITADGDIQIGSSDQTGGNADTITFNAEILSDIIPDNDNTYDLGSNPATGGKEWRNVFATNITTTSVTVTDLTISDTLDVSGVATFNGNVTLGTDGNNTVTFTGTIDSDLIPTTNNFYDIGTSALRWADSYFNRVEIDSLVIDNNVISTTANNDDLILSANGAGRIYIPTNDVQIDQALTVDGYTTLHGVSVTGDITQTGAVVQTGDYTQTGDTTITGNLTVSTFGQFEKIRVDGNIISTTATGEDLQLEANTTGKIYIPNNDVLFNQNLTVNGIATIDELSVTNTITAGSLSTGDLVIENNTITTLAGLDLELSANGTGRIYIPSNDVQLDQALTVLGTTSLAGTTIVGDITHTGNVTQTGDYTQTGNTEITGNLTVSTYGQFEKIRVDGDTISSATDTDLKLEANGTGRVYIPNDNVLISQNLTVNGTATISDLTVTNTLSAGALSDGDILIQNNVITTTIPDNNLELSANGSGIISIPTNNVQIDQALTVNGDTTLKATTINGTVTQIGDVTQTGDYTQTGATTITGNLTVSTFGQFQKIRIDGNIISGTATDTDVILEANGTGIISIPSNDVEIAQDLSVIGTVDVSNINVTTSVTAGTFDTGDITIQGNTITTNLPNSNLELNANGLGIITIPSNDVSFGQSLTVTQDLTVTTGTTNLKAVDVTGDITQTGDWDQTGDFTTSGSVDVTGNITGTGDLILPDITITGNQITTTTLNTDLDLRANGTGDIIFEELKVTNNNIQATVTNANITLTPQGTGSVVVSSNQSVIIPVGTSQQRPATPVAGMIRYNTDLNRYEGYNASYNKWLQLSGVEDFDGNTKITAELTPGANDNIIRFYADGNLTATIDATKLYAEKITTDGIEINNNSITAINTNSDINLTTSGTGGVKIGNLRIRNNTITNISAGAVTEFAETGTGYVKIAGTTGVVIPVGDNTTRPLTPVLGMMRFNTLYSIVEVWDGADWINVAGTSSGINITQATELGIVSALLYG